MAEPTSDERPAKRIRLEESENTRGTGEDDQLRKELRAGITHYVNPDTSGFSGVLKQRYTDFLVNEIELNGQVLHLTSTAVPVKMTNKKSTEQQDAQNGSNGAGATTIAERESSEMKQESKAEVTVKHDDDASKITEEQQAQLVELFGEPCTVAIIKLYHDVLKSPDKKPKDMRNISTWSIDDKSRRSVAHQAIRNMFKGLLTSTHADKNQLIISKAAKGGRGVDGSKWSRNNAGEGYGKGKTGWDQLGGEYLHFTLHKENKDTMEVISFMGTQMKCAPRHFQFAGTKDRRACTVQRISVYRQHAHQLAGLNKILKQGSKIGNFEYKQYPLELGALWGNEFVITLRDCHFPDEEKQWTFQDQLEHARKLVGQAVTNLQTNGFINYYGLQRFGSFTAGTDDVGKKLLQSDFEGAVNLILDFHPSALEAAQQSDDATEKVSSDDRNRAVALDIWSKTKSATKALEKLPRKFSAEKALISYLGLERKGVKIRENDYVGALQSMQRNMRLMYVHAYQSLVWNRVAGRRWEMYGSKVMEGDLVIVGEKREGEREEEEVDEDGEVIVRPAAEDSAANEGDFQRARPLTRDEANSGKFDIFDVVLPLPGWDVVYPKNEIGGFYKEFMGSDEGGGLDPYDMRRKWKDYSLSGGYRKLLSRPAEGMTFEVRGYKEETEQLVETDLERLEKASANKNGSGNGAANEEGNSDVKMGDGLVEGSKYIAVVLKMKLGSSQYATMALRELLKAGGLKSFKADFSGRGF